MSNDTVCEKCEPGRYSPHHSFHNPCWLCSRCGDDLYEAHPCTPYSDTICDSCHTYEGPHNEDFMRKCTNGVSSTSLGQNKVTRVPSMLLNLLEVPDSSLVTDNSVTSTTLDSTSVFVDSSHVQSTNSLSLSSSSSTSSLAELSKLQQLTGVTILGGLPKNVDVSSTNSSAKVHVTNTVFPFREAIHSAERHNSDSASDYHTTVETGHRNDSQHDEVTSVSSTNTTETSTTTTTTSTASVPVLLELEENRNSSSNFLVNRNAFVKEVPAKTRTSDTQMLKSSLFHRSQFLEGDVKKGEF